MPRMTRRAVCLIPVADVAPNPRQPRRAFDEPALCALAASIRENGLLQPIAVREVAGAGYELIAGERRLRAMARLGRTHIDALVLPVDAGQSALLALVENLQREDLHYLEEAEAYEAAMRRLGLTQEALAARIGISQSAVANKLRLLRLAPSVRESLVSLKLSERHARALLRLPDASLQRDAALMMAEQRLTVRQADALVGEMLRALPEQREARRRLRPTFVRDRRLYVNAIASAVREINQSGAQAQMEVRDTGETGGAVEVIVRISGMMEGRGAG